MIRRSRSGAGRFRRDQPLARIAARGEEEAFEILHDRYHGELASYAHALVGDRDEASDVLQTAFLKSYTALRSGAEPRRVRPWLFAIVHNEAISLLRRRAREPSLEEGAIVAEAREDDSDLRGRVRQLFSDLERLSHRQRSALLLRELVGLQYAEVASALGTSDAAAKQAVYEARLSLAELEQGRGLKCDEVRQAVSARDGRVLRARRLRSHLRSCDDCASYRMAILEKRSELAALSPMLAGSLGSVSFGAAGGATGVPSAGSSAPSAAGGAAAAASVGLALAVAGAAFAVLSDGAEDKATSANQGGQGGSAGGGSPARVDGRRKRGRTRPGRDDGSSRRGSARRPTQAAQTAPAGSPQPLSLGGAPPPTAPEPPNPEPIRRLTGPTPPSRPAPMPVPPPPSLPAPAPAPSTPPPVSPSRPSPPECRTVTLPAAVVRICS